jgi:hypothetical protein
VRGNKRVHGQEPLIRLRVVCGGMGGGVGFYMVCRWWPWLLCGVMGGGVGCDGWPMGFVEILVVLRGVVDTYARIWLFHTRVIGLA